MKLTGAQALIKSLEAQGTEIIFGLPGGAILPVYDPIIDSTDPPRARPPRAGRRPHGRGLRPWPRAVPAWPWSPRARARPTSSRRSADAYMDSIPLVVITGQVATAAIGTDAFQECDITGHHRWGSPSTTGSSRTPRTSPR